MIPGRFLNRVNPSDLINYFLLYVHPRHHRPTSLLRPVHRDSAPSSLRPLVLKPCNERISFHNSEPLPFLVPCLTILLHRNCKCPAVFHSSAVARITLGIKREKGKKEKEKGSG